MKWQPIPIAGGAYADEARPFAFQDCVNWLPVRAERPNTREQWKLTPVPGFLRFSTLENATTGASDRIRGLRNVEGRLYVVCGQSLFRVNTNGTVETVQENAVPGSGRVTMTHNQETGGYSLVIGNGYGGWTYNSGTSTFAQITDEGFPGFKACDFLDQYIVGISPDGLFAFHSDLANAGEYSTLDRYSAEAAPDRLVGQIVDHGQWWLFGERTTEIYTNTGGATSTFQRIPGSTIERGLAGTHAVAKLDNSVFWVGDDGVVYRANGFTPTRISTHPIERELSQCDLSEAFCMVYEDRGHKILYITCPDGKTWGYDVATQEWHRRESYDRSNWRITCLARWSGGWLGGDELSNRLHRVDWAYNTEDGDPLVCRRTSGILHSNENRVQLHAVKLVVDSGRIPGEARPLEETIYPVEIYNPLESASVGVAVDHNYLGRFGVPPYTFAVTAGSLPTGLSLASTGNLTGTPTTVGSYAWRVQITDSIGQTDTLDQGIDLAEGIDGGTDFDVGYPVPILLTDVNSYGGTPASLTAGAATGFNSLVDNVRVSPNGQFAIGGDMEDGALSLMRLMEYNTTTNAWDDIGPLPDLPGGTVFAAAFAWSPDSLYLAVNFVGYRYPWIWARSGSTFTLQAAPDSGQWIASGLSVSRSLVFDDAGARLAASTNSSLDSVYLWDFSAGQISNVRNLSGSGTNSIGGAPQRVSFYPGAGSSYLIGGNPTYTFVVNTATSPMDVVDDIANSGAAGVFFVQEGNYAIGVGDGAVRVYSFSVGTLTLQSTTTTGVPATLADAAMTSGKDYLALARPSTGAQSYPTLATVSAATPPVVTVIANPPTLGSAVSSVSWKQA